MNTATIPKPKPPVPRPGNGVKPLPVPMPTPVSIPNGTKPKLVKLDSVFMAPRILLNAVEGWGKSTCGAYAPNPAFLMAAGETGYETLLGSGLVPSVPAVRIATWPDLLYVVGNLNGIYESLVLDALGGFERMCHEFVCRRDYNGDWGEKGFTAYQKGYDLSISEWIKLLALLDQLHDKGMMILVLSHCKIKTFKNPLGADFDRYVSDVHDKTWSVTNKWADCVLFGNFYSVVESSERKVESLRRGKGIGGTERIIYTERRDAFDAKNRYGMPEVIDIPHDPTLVWQTIYSNIRKQKHD